MGEPFASVLAAAQAGAPWAFERLYAELSGPITGYLRMQRADEADDLASEVFIGVFTGLKNFSGNETQFRSWVFTIAHRRLIDERRRSLRQRWLSVESPETVGPVPTGNAEADALDELGRQWVYDVCDHLAADQKAVILLRVVGDLTVEQVADVLGKSVGAVKQLQRRGLNALRKEIEKAHTPAGGVERLRG